MPSEAKTLILNVNDSPAARYLVTRILHAHGFEVIEAVSGEEGLALAAERKPELVVLDIRLPDIDGHEVCRRLKADPSTPCAVLQTSATFVTGEGKARGLDAGADGYLTQPFETVEFVAMVRSLLRLRRTEQEARERSDALAAADRRKDEFLAMLAHELRNPLSAILVASQLLEAEVLPPERVATLSSTIGRQARHLGRLVDDLLDVSRITRDHIQLSPSSIDLTKMVRDRLETARLGSGHHRSSLSLPERPLHVWADATRISQVIDNLLGNAAKYTPAGGTIDVALERRAADGNVRFSVRDSGIGISSENQSSVWELFYQVDASLDRSQSGLGVGLTMVRRLIEMQGGKVGVESSGLGAGSKFWFELPEQAVAREAVTESNPVNGAPAQCKVLVVDDNIDSCDLYATALELYGHAVDTAHDGERGVALALDRPYDVAIVDIGLPGLNGYEVARRLHAELGPRRPYLIALTGYGRPEDKALAREAGFDAHRVKPADLNDVLSLFAHAREPRQALAG